MPRSMNLYILVIVTVNSSSDYSTFLPNIWARFLAIILLSVKIKRLKCGVRGFTHFEDIIGDFLGLFYLGRSARNTSKVVYLGSYSILSSS